MSITALDHNTSRQLSTTQVITSVLSVVKELVENSLDAEANTIEVNLLEKGLELIEVKDNGTGITKVDSAYMAMASHTSKIKKFDDLESLESYGFRGEALNALCRVSDVKIITKTHGEDAARCYIMNTNGNIQKAEFCCRTIGTTVQIHSLFKNIPVRRQIINDPKKASQDVKLIEKLLQDFGICRPEIRITYRVENVVVLRKIPGKTIRESLLNIFGKKMISQYEFIKHELPDYRIELIVLKKNQDTVDLSAVCHMTYQHIFVNNRPVTLKEYEKVIVRVLSEYFDGKFSGRKKPIFFLMISVLPSDVDVNLEPNKTIVLLKNNHQIVQSVEKMLIDYYGVELSQDSQAIPLEISNVSSPAYLDFSNTEAESNPEPTTKKRKIEKKVRKPVATKVPPEMFEKDKENVFENIRQTPIIENESRNSDQDIQMNFIAEDNAENSRTKKNTIDSSEYEDFPMMEDEPRNSDQNVQINLIAKNSAEKEKTKINNIDPSEHIRKIGEGSPKSVAEKVRSEIFENDKEIELENIRQTRLIENELRNPDQNIQMDLFAKDNMENLKTKINTIDSLEYENFSIIENKSRNSDQNVQMNLFAKDNTENLKTKKKTINEGSWKTVPEKVSLQILENDKENIFENIRQTPMIENEIRNPYQNIQMNLIVNDNTEKLRTNKNNIDPSEYGDFPVIENELRNSNQDVEMNFIANDIVEKSKTKKNTIDPIKYKDFPLREGETLSQLPEIDLGEDFSIQEIERKLHGEPNEIEIVTNAMQRLNSPKKPEIKDAFQSPEKILMTESQWSKGRHPLEMPGGTDIEAFGPSEISPKVVKKNPEERSRVKKKIQPNIQNKKTHVLTNSHEDSEQIGPPANASANSRGFFMFSREYRPYLLKMNPGINLVEMAKQLTSKWKEMSSEERESYRDLGMKNKSLSESRTSSPSTSHQLKIARTSPGKSETNKKRLINLIENMEAKKKTDVNIKEGKRELRKIVDWEININDIRTRINNKFHKSHFGTIIGPINADIWMARTNAQIWALSVSQLFDSLNLNETERLHNKGDSDFIEFCLNRCLREKESLNFMHPIYDMV